MVSKIIEGYPVVNIILLHTLNVFFLWNWYVQKTENLKKEQELPRREGKTQTSIGNTQCMTNSMM